MSLTDKGKQASQLRLNAYRVDDIKKGSFIDSKATVMDFTNCTFKQFPMIMQTMSGNQSPHNQSLTHVILPTGITSLADNAFMGCIYLKQIDNLFNSTKITSWSNRMLMNCSNITNMIIPAQVKSFGTDAFSGCRISNLDMSNMNWITTDDQALVARLVRMSINSTTSPSTITLPNAVSIGWGMNHADLVDALAACTVTPLVTLNFTDAVFSTDFQRIPAQIINAHTASQHGIWTNGFQNNKYIRELHLDLDAFDHIDPYAFDGCTNLEYVTGLSDVESPLHTISDYAFRGCKQLRDVAFSPNMKWIKQRAFENATIKVKAGVQLRIYADAWYNGKTTWTGCLGYNAFRNCMIYNADGSVIQYNVIEPDHMCSGVGRMETSGGLGAGWGQNMADCAKEPNKGVQIWGNTTALFGLLNNPAYNKDNQLSWWNDKYQDRTFYYTINVHRFDISGKVTDRYYNDNYWPSTQQ